MLSTILIPLDGSPLAERAMPYAIRLAQALHSRLILLHVASPLGWQSDDNKPDCDLTARLEAVADSARTVGLVAETRVFNGYFTEPGNMIGRAASERQADLIVMSTHGRRGPGRWIYGSVADQTLRLSKVPILLIPAHCSRTWGSQQDFRLMVPLDGSPLAEEALGPAKQLAEALGAEMLLVQISEPSPLGHPDAGQERAEAYEQLEHVARRLRVDGHMVSARVAGGFAVPSIASIAREERVNLIVMATHGRSGLARQVMGSVATSTIQLADVPLLLVRPASMRQVAASSNA